MIRVAHCSVDLPGGESRAVGLGVAVCDACLSPSTTCRYAVNADDVAALPGLLHDEALDFMRREHWSVSVGPDSQDRHVCPGCEAKREG